MAEIGDTITEDGGERKTGRLKEFFSKPENIATAIVLGMGLTQPRQGGRNALQTLAQRGTGALAFRGQLQRGIRGQRQEDAEQRRADTAQELQSQQVQQGAERNTITREQIAAQNQRSTAEIEARAGESEADRAARAEQNALNRETQVALAGMPPPQNPQDILRLLPALMESQAAALQFDPNFINLPIAEKNQIVMRSAMEALLRGNELFSSGAVSVDANGQIMVDTDQLGAPGGGLADPFGGQLPPAAQPVTPAAPTDDLSLGPPESARGTGAPSRSRQEQLTDRARRREADQQVRNENIAANIRDFRDSREFGGPGNPATEEFLLSLTLREMRDSGMTSEEIRDLLRAQGKEIVRLGGSRREVIR